MAQEVEVKIKVVTGDAEKSFDSLTNSVKVLNNEATNLDATFEEIYGDLKPLTARMGEAEDRLYELAKAGKTNTREYKELLKSVAEYKRVQQQTDLVVDAAAERMSTKLAGALNVAAGGFALAQGSMAIMGSESKELQEAMLKVQAALAISQGVESINQGSKSITALATTVKSYAIVQKAITAGQYLWNAAISANPIGLLISAIVGLIAGGVALVNYFKENSLEAEKNTQSVKANKTALENQSKAADSSSKSLQTNSDYQIAMAKASGASTAAIRKLELKLIDEKIAFANSSREIAKNTYHKNLNALASLKASDADEEQIKAQEEITKKSLEEFGKQTKNLNDANAEKGNIIRKQNVEIRQEQTNHNTKVTETNKAATKKAKEDKIAQDKEDLANLNAGLEAQKNATENGINEITEAIGNAQDKQSEFLISAQQVEEQKVKDKYFRLLELANQQKRSQEEIDALETARLNELNEIRLKADEENLAKKKEQANKELEIEKAVADGKKAIQEQSFAVAEGGINLLKGLFEKNKAIQKGLIVAESAVGIAKIIIGTQAANAADTAAAALMGPAGVGYLATKKILNKVSAGIGIAANIAATSKALGALGGGGASGGGNAGSAGGAVATPMAAQPINVVGASQTNAIAQTIAQQGQQPIKAYVVANDVTTQQSLDRNIVSSASIG